MIDDLVILFVSLLNCFTVMRINLSFKSIKINLVLDLLLFGTLSRCKSLCWSTSPTKAKLHYLKRPIGSPPSMWKFSSLILKLSIRISERTSYLCYLQCVKLMNSCCEVVLIMFFSSNIRLISLAKLLWFEYLLDVTENFFKNTAQ